MKAVGFASARHLLAAEDYCDLQKADEQPDFAESLEDMNEFSIALGVFLWIAGMAALIPQHVKLWSLRSSSGLSFYMLFLWNVSQVSSVINAIILKFPQLRACEEVGLMECSPSLLTLYQLGGIWLFTFPLYWWYLLFFKRTEEFKKDKKKRKRDWLIARILLVVFILYTATTLAVGFCFLEILGECDDATINFGWSVGILSMVCTFIQWTPQIYATWRLGAVGSYSIITLGIQAPGTMVVVYFLLFLSNENISTWLAYFTAGIQQLVLLALLIYFTIRNRKREKKKKAIRKYVVESLQSSVMTDSDDEMGNVTSETMALTSDKGALYS